MNLATVITRAAQGIRAPRVNVEVHLSNGLPSLSIVGLPETAVKESKDRVRAAILNSRFDFPTRRITVNLAPADLPKEGGRFDLPIALGILAASGQIPAKSLDHMEFVGELGLSGEVRPIRGALPVALRSAAATRPLVVPKDNAHEAALVRDCVVLPTANLSEVCAHLRGLEPLQAQTGETATPGFETNATDLSDVRGQRPAKRALEVAAAGGHNALMIGPPGTGKTMLASRFTGLLPPLTERESMESAAIASISEAGFDFRNWGRRPFRTPHHTASGVALVGGGSQPRPGEISLAHHGVLFLDELTEFDRRVLEVLREPLETGRIVISRAARQAEFPATFQFIAAMNPCPQGYDCDLKQNCRCTPEQQRRHRNRISAPLLDRIDVHIHVAKVPRELLRVGAGDASESSAQVRDRVCAARGLQLRRQGHVNAALSNREIEAHCRLTDQDHALLDAAMTRFRLSARAYHRILKVARTIADLQASARIESPHLTEAITYRTLDRFLG